MTRAKASATTADSFNESPNADRACVLEHDRGTRRRYSDIAATVRVPNFRYDDNRFVAFQTQDGGKLCKRFDFVEPY